MAAKRWIDDDEGYEKWVSDNPQGFLANLNRQPHKRYFKIHRASHRLADRSVPGSVNPRTGNNYTKLTANSLSEIISWVGLELPSLELTDANYCKVCDWGSDGPVDTEPTPDVERYILQADKLLARGVVSRPAGVPKPMTVKGTIMQFYRDPKVRAWVLQRAAGHCELCETDAPFLNDDDIAFLECHHVIALAEGGPDTPENTAALCPNCHREIHYGKERCQLRDYLAAKITKKECGFLSQVV